MEIWILLRISLVYCCLTAASDCSEDDELTAPLATECPTQSDGTSMLQVISQVDARKASSSKKNTRMKESVSHSQTWNATSLRNGAELFNSALSDEFENWRNQRWNATKRCMPFETSTAANGMPVCIEALIFGLLGTASMPLGAILGVIWAPMSKELIAQYLALGSGALTFAVATQLYGDHLFALVAISRQYGPIRDGCYGEDNEDLCFGKLFDLLEMMIAGLFGAWLYVQMTHWLETLFSPVDMEGNGDEIMDKEKLLEINKTGSSRKQEDHDHDAHGSDVAIAMWFGMLVDCVPEALMLGLMTNQHKLKFGFLFAIFLSNFPEAFSGAGILREHNWSSSKIFLLWSLIFLFTGIVAMAGSFVMPESCAREAFTNRLSHVTAIAQGLSGGMMLAMMASAMLPESYRRYGPSSGLFFVLGFVISVAIQTVETYFASPQEILHHAFPHTSPFAQFSSYSDWLHHQLKIQGLSS